MRKTLTKALILSILFLDTWYEEQPRIKQLRLNRNLRYWQLYFFSVKFYVISRTYTACTLIETLLLCRNLKHPPLIYYNTIIYTTVLQKRN